MDEMDQLAVEHAATVYAIEFLKQKAVKETKIRLTGDFVDEILHKNFNDSALAIERGRKLGFDLLIQMQEMGMNLQEFYEVNIGPLTQMKRQGADLLLTLETYLLSNQSMHTTAAELFIHRHTLKYRLNQIEKKTGLVLNSPDDRMKLQLAIMAYI